MYAKTKNTNKTEWQHTLKKILDEPNQGVSLRIIVKITTELTQIQISSK